MHPPPVPASRFPKRCCWTLGVGIWDGAVDGAGLATKQAGRFTVKGAGADIWGTVDAFHYAYRTLAGDGQIVARVTAVSGSQAWTKAGVMIRQALTASSAHAYMLVSADRGVAFQRRLTTGGISTHTGGAGAAPRWVKLSRTGDAITASVSTDGTTWSVVGSDTFPVGPMYVGLAVTSHDRSQLATGTFDSVIVTP